MRLSLGNSYGSDVSFVSMFTLGALVLMIVSLFCLY